MKPDRVLGALRLDHKAPHAILIAAPDNMPEGLRLDHKAPHAILTTVSGLTSPVLRLDHKAPHAILQSSSISELNAVAVGSQSTACYTT